MNATIAALVEKHLNSTLTSAEAAMLAQAMAESPALAEEFVAATRMESDLSASMKDGARTALYTRRMERAAAETEPVPIRRQWPVKTMTAVAGVAALIGVGWRLMEVETGTTAPTKKSSPSLPQYYSGGSAALSGDTRAADASALKSRLRRFASSTSNLRSVPVSQAVATLQSEWKNYAHGNAKDKQAAFAIAESVSSEWRKPEDEPVVSLEIPGISLLTSLELIAAQAGLNATVTSAGVSLEPPLRKDDGKDRTWTIPLSLASVTTFMRAVSSDRDRMDAGIAWGNYTMSGLTAPGLVRADRPSWMQVPESAQAPGWSNYSNSGPVDGGVVTWDYAINMASFDPTGTRIFLNTTDAGITLSNIPSGGGGLHDLWVEGLPQAVLSEVSSDVSNDLIAVTGDGQASEVSTIAVAADLSSDGYTIDLNLAPEVIEFEGFINYGEPIQTTGINALGQSEPVILTDIKITQPDFATRVLLDYPASLSRLLAAHGMPAESATWDQDNGIVTARGPLSRLRAAHAAVAAVEESASAGVTVEMKVIEWKNGVPPPKADPSGLLPVPAIGSSDTVILEAAAALLMDPGVERVAETKATQRTGVPFTLKETRRYDVAAAKGITDSYEAGVIADVSGIAAKGFTWHLPVKIRRTAVAGTTTTGDSNGPIIESGEHNANVHLQDGEWLRVDFPAEGNAKAVTVLLRVEPATVP